MSKIKSSSGKKGKPALSPDKLVKPGKKSTAKVELSEDELTEISGGGGTTTWIKWVNT